MADVTVQPEKLEVSQKLKTMMFVAMGIGVLTFLVGAFNPNGGNLWPAFLTSFFYFASLAVGGLFFTAIQYAVNAGWSSTVRRVAESFTSFLPVAFVLGLVLVFFGGSQVYEWYSAELMASDPLLTHKTGYLNQGAFAVRTVIFFLGWGLLAKIIVGNSLKQDEDGDENRTHKNVRWSIGFLVFFSLSYSLFSVDYLMSLHPHWFSTIFGVYTFSGLFQSSLAFILILTIWLMNSGYFKGGIVNENHLHDLGKLLFAFTVFYAYIGFSQFMLIWYANLPEETIFFVHRAHGGWMAVSMSLLVCKFIVPFMVLLPRGSKRNPQVLVAVSVLVLIMQFVDNYWLVYPNFNEGHLSFGLTEVGIFIGFLGAFLFTVTRFLSKNSLVAHKDPRIHEALHHHI